MTQTSSTTIQFNMFPTETTSNGTGITFEITLDTLPED